MLINTSKNYAQSIKQISENEYIIDSLGVKETNILIEENKILKESNELHIDNSKEYIEIINSLYTKNKLLNESLDDKDNILLIKDDKFENQLKLKDVEIKKKNFTIFGLKVGIVILIINIFI